MKLMNLLRRSWTQVGVLIAGGLLLVSGQALALTDAGQDITNEATVSYEDALGNTFTSTSNEAVVTVAEVFSATLAADRTREGAPGQTVYFQHLLKNTGNTSDTYTVSTFRDDDFNGSDDNSNDSDYFVFRDQNNNGQPDAGEPTIVDPANADGTITLAADETARLLVAFPIPGGAADGTDFGVNITVVSGGGGLVDDLTDAGGGADGNDGTNNDVATARTGVVLNPVKQATFEDGGTPNDPTDDSVLYTLQVSNTGGTSAFNVDIADAIPANTTFDAVVSISGLIAANGDLQMTGATAGDPTLDFIGTNTPGAFDINETDLGLTSVPAGAVAEDIDVDISGTAGDNAAVTAIFFRDAELPPNTTISIQYRVDIDSSPVLPAGTEIPNIFIADDVESPEVTIEVPQAFGVSADDTGDDLGDAADSINDGGDDDDTLNNVQLVGFVSDGDTVLFTNVITNDGNGDDTFELSIANDGAACGTPFPTGTSFSFFNASNTATLGNTNGEFGADTGELAADESLTITVRADLPDGQAGVGPFCATLTATSAGDNSVTDTKTEQVTEIVAPQLDLANADYDTGTTTLPQEVSATVTSPADAAATSELNGFNDGGTADAHPDSGVATFANVSGGDTQDFELFIANEGVAPDSYNLTVDAVPSGWTLTFIQRGVDTNSDGTLDNTTGAGTTVTTTPLIPAGAVYQYTARIVTSVLETESLANPSGGSDANTDGDNDYIFTFTATSTTNPGSFDSKVDAIDIEDNAALEVAPDLNDQVQPGGSVDYSNTVTNTGNVLLTVRVTSTHSLAGFDDTTLIDTDGDGVGDTELENLGAGPITVDDGAGGDQTIEVTLDGGPVFELEPGEVLPLEVTVQAPANAAQGDEDFFVILGEDTSGTTVTDDATDRTEVITVQVRLTKTVAVDTGCVCDPTLLTFPAPASSGATAAADEVEPDECVVWLLTATNQSTQSALNVSINDSVTPFTQLEQPTAGTDDGIYFCGPSASTSTCPLANTDLVTAAADADEATVTGNDLSFDVGTLAAGEAAIGSFCVRVD